MLSLVWPLRVWQFCSHTLAWVSLGWATGPTLVALALTWTTFAGGGALWGSHEARRKRRFGYSVLELRRSPVRPGEFLDAVLVLDHPFEASSVTLRVACMRMSGGEEGEGEAILWEQVAVAAADGVRIPVRVELPGHLPPSDLFMLDTRIVGGSRRMRGPRAVSTTHVSCCRSQMPVAVQARPRDREVRASIPF